MDPFKMVVINIIGCILLASLTLVYKFVYPKKNLNLFCCLILISILPIISIFRTGTYQSGDLTIHTVFLQSFFENLKDGVLFPRWAGGLCGGYGCPVFIILYTLPYYIGSFFHLLGFTYLDSIKCFLAFSYIVSGITMFKFINREYGEVPAFIGSLLYLFAPTHLTDIHFRVSVGTVAAYMFMPLSFMFIKESLNGKISYIILGSINTLLLILSHSSVSFVIIPASFIYALLYLKNVKSIIYPILSLLLGIGLASFYVLPALFEVKYTWYNPSVVVIVSDFRPLIEYLFSFAKYGLLFQGNHGELRLIIGYAHILVIVATILALINKTIDKKNKSTVIFLLTIFFLCFILLQSFTANIWNSFFFLKSFQFPWRLLVPISFITSLLGAIVIKGFKNKYLLLFCIFIVLSTILNWGNRKMVILDPNAYSNQWSIYSEYYEMNNQIYMSRYASRFPRSPELIKNKPSSHLQILSGNGLIKEVKRTKIEHTYLLNAENNLTLAENTYYFPGWHVYVNGKNITLNIKNKDSFGTLSFSLPKGIYLIDAKFEDTKATLIGEIISAILLMLIIVVAIFKIIPYLTFHKLRYVFTKFSHV